MAEIPTFANKGEPSKNSSEPAIQRVEEHAPLSFVWGNTLISPDQVANQVSDAIVEPATKHKS